MRQTTHFDVLDFYRYGGALFVAIDHFMLTWLPVDNFIRMRVHLDLQPLMGFFFTLSGFVIIHTYSRKISTVSDYLGYLKKRFARIYPLHLATFGLAILWWWTLSWQPSYWFNSDAIVPNILLIQAWNTVNHLSFNYPSWSVSAEFFVYLLFPIFVLAVDWLGLWGALLLPLISAVAISAFFDANGLGSWTYATWNYGCLRAVPSFIGGMAIYRIATLRFANLVVPAWIAHATAIATIPLMLLGAPGPLVLGIFLLVVFLLARAEPSAGGGVFSTPLFRALASCSYSFYMLHVFVGTVMLGRLPKLIHVNGLGMFGLAALALVVTTAISILSFRYFEDPARRYFSRLTPAWQRVKQ